MVTSRVYELTLTFCDVMNGLDAGGGHVSIPNVSCVWWAAKIEIISLVQKNSNYQRRTEGTRQGGRATD